jgi:hypothetical protein
MWGYVFLSSPTRGIIFTFVVAAASVITYFVIERTRGRTVTN